MAITGPFSITYGGRQVGAGTSYQLLGAHVIRKSYDALALVFDVQIVASTVSNLDSLSSALEGDFRKRLTHGQTLVIDLNGNQTTYTQGTDLLEARAQIEKTGNPGTDYGLARAYTITIEASLPADADSGLRDLEADVIYDAARLRTVTMRGVYTALSGTHAAAQYQSDFAYGAGGESKNVLDMVDGVRAAQGWELVDESYSLDRHQDGSGDPFPHLCRFYQQYRELNDNEVQGSLDDATIRDHRVTFTDTSQHPGDGIEKHDRLRRVVGTYDCAVDVSAGSSPKTVLDGKIVPHLKALFQTEYKPKLFCLEDARASIDKSGSRVSVSFQFAYVKSGASDKIVESSVTVAYREAQQNAYTWAYSSDPFAAYVDPGWGTLERIWSRVVIALGEDEPRVRIADRSRGGGAAGAFDHRIGKLFGPDKNASKKGVVEEGWNLVGNLSQAESKYVGDPGHKRIQLTVLNETVMERYTRKPTAGPTRVPSIGGGRVVTG